MLTIYSLSLCACVNRINWIKTGITVHPESISRALLVPYFVILQPYSKWLANVFTLSLWCTVCRTLRLQHYKNVELEVKRGEHFSECTVHAKSLQQCVLCNLYILTLHYWVSKNVKKK